MELEMLASKGKNFLQQKKNFEPFLRPLEQSLESVVGLSSFEDESSDDEEE